MILFILFIFGLFVGSFLNVLIDRLPRDESFIKGRSYCESCKTQLKWYDLIPLLSFVTLKGKCRYCRIPLSYYYPIVELTTGIMFAILALFAFNNLPFTIYHLPFISLFYYLFIASCLIVIFFVDLKYGIIPDKITYTAIAVSFAYLLHNTYYIIPFIASALGGFLFFLAIFLGTRGRGMGFGDVKFAFLIGLIVGYPNIVIAFYSAFLTGAIISVILIILKKKKFKGSTIPFGPFMVIGTFVALFFSKTILKITFPFL